MLLRKVTRKFLRIVTKNESAEPKEVNFEVLKKLMKDNNIPYSELENENLREFYIAMEEKEKKARNNEENTNPKQKEQIFTM